LACGLVLASALLPASAFAVVLYDQTGNPGLEKTESMNYAAPDDVEAADDFTVPAGQQWTISEVDVLGKPGDPSSLDTNVRIYADAGGAPGGVLFQQTGIKATHGPSYYSPLSNVPPLGPGTYWISVSVSAFWGWLNSTTQVGHPAAWQNPSGLYKGGCGKTWTTRSTCFSGTAAEPDQAFRLIGPEPTLIAAPVKPSNAFSFGALKRKLKKGTAMLTVNVPGPGALALSGKGLKAVKATASSAGSLKLKLTAIGKAKKKLNKSGKAKVKANVTFTPNGGDPATQTKTVKLKKKR
jgi:hypothetical protein